MSDWADEKAIELGRDIYKALMLSRRNDVYDAYHEAQFVGDIAPTLAAALREAYEAGRASRMARTYNTNKLQEQVGKRDGWTCHYCGCLLVPSGYRHVEHTPRKQLLEHGSPFEIEIKDRLRRGAIYATIDHVIPRSKGGSDEPTNLVLSCPYCNSNKSTRSMEKAL